MEPTPHRPDSVPTWLFDWGRIKWRITPGTAPGTELTVGDVDVHPGMGHDRHRHPESDEVIYVLSGTGEQTVGDGPAFPVAAGDAVHVPRGVLHSTFNTGWSTLRLVVVYSPAGAEEALRAAPDFREAPAGEHPGAVNR